MMTSLSRSSQLTRRIRRIKKELSSVHSDIRSLSRKMAKRGNVIPEEHAHVSGYDAASEPFPPFGAASGHVSRAQGFAEAAPARQDAPFFPGTGQNISSLDETADGQFGRQPVSSIDISAASAVNRQRRSGPAPQQSAPTAKPLSHKDERFASYFMSGGLRKEEPLRQEQNLQRNKAIFLLLFGLLLLFALLYFTLWK